ncbi:hypothetical protein [Rhizobium oryzicola]|uniref:Uncharacterized protein n=1 Tax=Rhizobium oryzicola TaxID=1232668 RepID=A0ABT8SWA5_9HYPH|nr:hypothetical protein [Rhizobium oryzicola]MDO1582306.1 hypothetical protein [Rhizobium oryzicola]
MVTSKSVAVPPRPETERALNTPEMIDRMAAELRARSDTDLPHSFYVEQIRKQLSGEMKRGANDANLSQPGQAHPSVFHAWALSE